MSLEVRDDIATASWRERSPRPYPFNDVQTSPATSSGPITPPLSRLDSSASIAPNHRFSAADRDGSGSGTEADDERPRLLALPPAGIVSRKGLIHPDGSVSPLLTPSQLDKDAQRFYFAERTVSRGRRHEFDVGSKRDSERRKFEVQRRAERIRRVSEAFLLASIGLTVAYGSRIWRLRWQWYLLEVLSQFLAIAGLVAFYPLRLVSVEHDAGHVHIWSRFYVPPSFDPATILYPTFLPTLAALSLVKSSPEILLPNLILGLSCLPARLFPHWSKSTHINVLHWFVAIVPLGTARLAALLVRRVPIYFSTFSLPDTGLNGRLSDEQLLLLFPLQQALLGPLHHLTTSSLLPAEKHLLSTALVNILLFSHSPQNVILCAALWIGGAGLLITCAKVLAWNVALARIPSWRLHSFKSDRHNKYKPTSLNSIINFLTQCKDTLSESEDDLNELSLLRTAKENRMISMCQPKASYEPKDALGLSDSCINGNKTPSISRRNTIANGHGLSSTIERTSSLPIKARRAANKRRDWVRQLSPSQARMRKFTYAAYTYASIATLVLFPIRFFISNKALQGAEPILWGLDYLFGSLWSFDFHFPKVSVHNTVPDMRSDLTPSLTRLVIIAYYAIILGTGLTILLFLSPTIQVDTRRKTFHAIMVLMLLPSLPIDPCFVSLALIVALALFLVLEVIRAGQIAPLGTAIGRFVAPYVDGRDLRGPMVVSHVFLLIGCAIPCWLSLGAAERVPGGDGWELEGEKREVAAVAGVICVGMGDAAASLIGRRIGRHKWPWIGGKSLEGSAAFAVAVWAGLSLSKAWLWAGGWVDVHATHGPLQTLLWSAKALLAGCGASFMEAVLTGANDNVVVPVALWLLCRGLGL